MNFYAILADIILVIHIAYVSYAVFGQLLILIGWPLRWRWIRNPWFRISHLIMILIVAFEALVDIQCPLTVWERQLRGEIGGGSFTGQLVHGFLTVEPETLNLICAVLGGVVVATIFLAPPRFRKQAAPPPAGSPVADAPGSPGSPPGHVPFDGDAHETLRRADDA